RRQEDAFPGHLGGSVKDQARILEMVKQAKQKNVIKTIFGSEAIGVRIIVHELERDVELARGKFGLAQEFCIRIYENAAASAALFHADREIARVATEVKHGGAFEILGNVRLDQ